MNKKWLAVMLAAFTFASTPAFADDDWDDDDDHRRPRPTQVHQKYNNSKRANQNTKISYERAEQIAQNYYKGARVTDIDLERKRGRLVYQVDLKKYPFEYEVWVDAQTGEVVYHKKERD